MEKAVQAARKAFEGECGNLPLKEWLNYIYKIAEVIDEHIDEIAPLESYDTGLLIFRRKKWWLAQRKTLGFTQRWYQADSLKMLIRLVISSSITRSVSH
ncbi:aldehyde dehydrogenase family protein [Halobacillus naozhouensis]|uniref:Aldehyde dehydrogenase family protein n=1 Tax=Halobacillus naozhouensis TaxID=554880 RepID=A0ABY8J306_9BACI|nr:aldehyde dehydrogenase family protein [Halobacillus naozhouensis]WFT76874.1 aldehyde dehydrogenase family protein [Halobacillus naozhouensis]